MPERDLEARLRSYLARGATRPAPEHLTVWKRPRPIASVRWGQAVAAAAMVILALGLGLIFQTVRQQTPGAVKPSASASPSPTTSPSAMPTVPTVPQVGVPTGPWVRANPPAGPGGREGAAMAYDAASGEVVLFGGTGCPERCPNLPVFGDTWTWDGGTWTRRQPSASPSARYHATMAYDAARGVIVLFGGARPGFNPDQLGDTWTWDGRTWIEQHPTVSPSAREGASMAFDTARRQVVLFGGGSFIGGRVLPPETWAWDGSAWSRLSPEVSPPARTLASMAYDETRHVVVLFGGGPSAANYLADTWTWDGRTWSKEHPEEGPYAKFSAAMEYAGNIGAVVMFGGEGCTMGCVGQDQSMWSWNGTKWVLLQPLSSPPPRFGASMAYDAKRQRLVLFGGRNAVDYLNDTWTWLQR